jgi:GNAT superfamily N-acetyltransferase
MALGLLGPLDTDAVSADYESTVRALDGVERTLVVAELDGVVVGMAQLVRSGATNARHRAEVRRVAVASAVRGTGVGRGLMAAVEDAARANGLTLLWLTTHADTDADRFYEAIGYMRLGVMPSYSRRPDGALASGVVFYREL